MATAESKKAVLDQLQEVIATLSPDDHLALLFVAQKLAMSDDLVGKLLVAQRSAGSRA